MSSSSEDDFELQDQVTGLKADHSLRPLYINDTGLVILERFSPLFTQAQDLLITIAEPVSRPSRIHEYKITEYSLYAAMSMGLESIQIVEALESMSKTNIPIKLKEYILKVGEKIGKIRVLLKQGEYFLEFWDREMLLTIQRDRIMGDCIEGEAAKSRMGQDGFAVPIQQPIQPQAVQLSGSRQEFVERSNEPEQDGIDLFDLFEDEELDEIDLDQFNQPALSAVVESEPLDQNSIPSHTNIPNQVQEDHTHSNNTPLLPEEKGVPPSSVVILPTQVSPPSVVENDPISLEDEEDVNDRWVYTLKINKEKIETVKKRCAELKLPLLEEYDFRNDSKLPRLDIDLKPATKLRPYQEQSLGKMFGNGRARSGIIVLPCGAGKTLVGVTAACTVKKSCLVLCNSTLSVEQWSREFRYWSTIKPDQLAKFSSESKQSFASDAGVLISTYTMIAYSGKRAYDAQKMMEFIQSREWGFVLLDEVHVVPADMFKKTLTIVAAHSKLGLTATLVREDDKIDSLNWLIGPKLFEANWLELIDDGFIANVQCAEVWCSMATPFYREYLRATPRKRQLLYVMNPHKLQACQYLIHLHETIGDKIIVFSDNIFSLKHYAETLQKPFIYGGTSQAERMRVLQQFRFNPALNTIFLSKVGDTSLDLPGIITLS